MGDLARMKHTVVLVLCHSINPQSCVPIGEFEFVVFPYQWKTGTYHIRVALIYACRNFFFVFLLSHPLERCHLIKKIVSDKVYCNRTTGKGADEALKFRIHQ